MVTSIAGMDGDAAAAHFASIWAIPVFVVRDRF
ncbi:hypothetical protein J2T09_000548 [Neorhizobium huautlense]|uniref:Uncharacterized protein n=1 Tax=Neorhizobium huautlense TaxID=67774 RepID=A0ABT9PNM1_9HYPH|nr:hypothetical protein [Neorhizobium huautlense]